MACYITYVPEYRLTAFPRCPACSLLSDNAAFVRTKGEKEEIYPVLHVVQHCYVRSHYNMDRDAGCTWRSDVGRSLELPWWTSGVF